MPSIAHTFFLVLQQEREFGGPQDSSTTQESIAFSSISTDPPKQTFFNKGNSSNGCGGRRSGSGRGRGNKLCTYCGKNNHIVDTCF
jgi:hypothetical protein